MESLLVEILEEFEFEINEDNFGIRKLTSWLMVGMASSSCFSTSESFFDNIEQINGFISFCLGRVQKRQVDVRSVDLLELLDFSSRFFHSALVLSWRHVLDVLEIVQDCFSSDSLLLELLLELVAV